MTGTEITTSDLADEMATRYDLTVSAAQDAVTTYVQQIVELDGEDATIVSREDYRNGHGQWVTLTADAADAVREAFAAEYQD